jgi:hypothetical protein
MNLYEAQWLAYALPYRRFAAALTDCDARLGADMDRYSFIVSDLHRLLVAGLPAHCERSCTSSDFPAEHWKHLRTTNVIESSFATVRHRTIRKTALAMIFKLAEAVEKSWHASMATTSCRKSSSV